MELHTQVNGSTISSMAMALRNGLMELVMKATLSMVSNTATVSSSGVMVANMMDNSKATILRVLGTTNGLINESIRVSGRIIK
jgi:hypothetical protein